MMCTCKIIAKCLWSILIITTSTVNTQDFKPLGFHSAPSKGAMVLFGKFPPPFVLFHHFVKIGKPLMMKNVLEKTGCEIYKTWSDEYLRDKYGNVTIEIEKSKKEDRKKVRSKLPFSKFLDLYQKIDMYLINSTTNVFSDEIPVPYSLGCGGFQKMLQDSYLWLSSGGTRSVLHYDMLDNLKCLLDGEKSIVLIDKKHKDKVETDGFVRSGHYSLVDVDAVDTSKFPGVAGAPWAEITMTKGDCVYIPFKYNTYAGNKVRATDCIAFNIWHLKHSASYRIVQLFENYLCQISDTACSTLYCPTAPGRSLAINFWFSHLLWFNKTDCDTQGDKAPFIPLKDFKLASPNEQLRAEMFSQFQNLEDIKRETFLAESSCKESENEQIWKLMNSNNDDKLTWEEIYSINMDDLVVQAPECVRNLLRAKEDRQPDNQDLRSTSFAMEEDSDQEKPASQSTEESELKSSNIPSEDAVLITKSSTASKPRNISNTEKNDKKTVHDEF